MRTLLIASAVAVTTFALTGWFVKRRADNCFCVRRQASATEGSSLDTWANFGTEVGIAEVLFRSINGQTGVSVFVANVETQSTAIDIDNFGPNRFAVPPGAAIQLRCTRRGVGGGCQTDYQFRWIR
jgi:hypothetical protein